MPDKKMANRLELRWIHTVDERGRTRMEARWVDTSVVTSSRVTHAA